MRISGWNTLHVYNKGFYVMEGSPQQLLGRDRENCRKAFLAEQHSHEEQDHWRFTRVCFNKGMGSSIYGILNSLHPEFFIVERKKRKAVENDVLQGLLDHHEHSVKVEQQVLGHQPTDSSPPKHERRCMRKVPAQALWRSAS